MRTHSVATAMMILLLLALPAGAAAPDAHRDVVIDAPAAIQQLERSGLDLGSVAFGHAAMNNAELRQDAAWTGIIRLVTDALTARRKADRQLGVGFRFSHRLFDAGWLTARQARFALIAVVNRMDRAAFAADGCGETRLVYRLAYDRGDDASRLPMTINVLFRQPGTCFEAWKRWPWQTNRDPMDRFRLDSHEHDHCLPQVLINYGFEYPNSWSYRLLIRVPK